MINFVTHAWTQYFAQGWHMSPIFLVLLVGLCIQGMKVVIDILRYKKLSFWTFVSSGGFPSFHTGLSSSVVTFCLLEYGVNSPFFMVSLCFGLLFAYDAMNLRYESGQHAHYINVLRYQLQEVLHKSHTKNHLKERLGHTPLEVFGGMVFGTVLTFVLYYWFYVR